MEIIEPKQEQIQDYWARSLPMSFIGEAVTYEEKREFRYSLQDYMRNTFQFSDFAGKLVLDLGCGAGNHSKFLAENGFDVYGIDGSRSVIKICKKRFKEWKLRASFEQGDFLNLPYKDSFFDLVIDRESLVANRFRAIKKAIKEVYKKLKNNGTFISFIYNSYHPDISFGKMIEINTYKDFKKGSSLYKTGVAHFVDLKEILELYSKFKIENIIRHSISEVYNKEKKIIEYDEYIIIAKK